MFVGGASVFIYELWFKYDISIISQQAVNIKKLMKSKLLYLLSGTAIGAGSHYAYRYFNPERNINSATKDIVSTFVSNHNL